MKEPPDPTRPVARTPNAADAPIPDAPAERRATRTLGGQRHQWASVRRWMARHDLDDFHARLDSLARMVFGADATVVPHLRWSGRTQYLVFVVDAAHPEASTSYESFLPLERAFWTAYATVPKPNAVFVVAVRPARGWCRSEALAPLYSNLPVPEPLA
ncbi:MAG TPA: hypothetical protein VFY16_06655 [Gemmatimonadaceae bacterium]|nr:hypothetical protein [Gemmatimonadaceae bacterium]